VEVHLEKIEPDFNLPFCIVFVSTLLFPQPDFRDNRRLALSASGSLRPVVPIINELLSVLL